MPSAGLARPARNGLFAGVCIILVLQAGASRLLSFEERDLPAPKLREIPGDLGPWKASGEQTLDADIVDYLQPADYILRDYVSEDGRPPVNLFVAYFKSLDKTYGPHAPRICLPGSGWIESSGKISSISVPNNPSGIPVNQLTYEKDGKRILVFYWYQNDRNIWAEEFQAKLRLLPDLIRYQRSDVSLVRIVAPMKGLTPDRELTSALEFIRLAFPHLTDRFAARG